MTGNLKPSFPMSSSSWYCCPTNVTTLSRLSAFRKSFSCVMASWPAGGKLWRMVCQHDCLRAFSYDDFNRRLISLQSLAMWTPMLFNGLFHSKRLRSMWLTGPLHMEPGSIKKQRYGSELPLNLLQGDLSHHPHNWQIYKKNHLISSKMHCCRSANAIQSLAKTSTYRGN